MTEPNPSNAVKSGRFSLLELCIVTLLVCITAGLFSWARIEPGAIVLVAVAAFATTVFTVYTLTHWSLMSIIVWTAVIFVVGICAMPFSRFGAREAARRMQCSNHLRQIGLALHNYHDTYGSLPPAYVADADGKPIHSWRVLILPFMENKPLYDKYRFDEAWDGPNNSKLHGEIVHVFSCPSQPGRQRRTDTSYVVVSGPVTAWPGDKPVKLSEFTDGTSNTILVVEIANSGIHWMEPRDLQIDEMPMSVGTSMTQGISSHHPNVVMAVYADGHTQALTKNTPPEILRALFTIASGEMIGDY